MKSILLFLFSFIIYNSISAQEFDNSTYLNEEDEIEFSGDSIRLTIMSNGGFLIPMVGKGTYQVFNNQLIIKTIPTNGIDSTYQFGDTIYLDNKTLVFQINNIKNSTLNLTLIGSCKNSEYNGQSTLKSFEKNHKKLVYRNRELKKKN